MNEPTYVKKLPSGYWHVRFGRQRFVQWPHEKEPTQVDVFPVGLENSDAILAAALKATREEEPRA